MLEKIIELELPVGENLAIWKNHIETDPLGPRIAIVSGIHGDELEGQYICYELARRIKENLSELHGQVDIYPAINPLGIETAKRNDPLVNMDMNRMFPGRSGGNMQDRLLAAVVDNIIGADICIDLHASDIYVREIPQVRLSEEFAEKLLPLARLSNVDMIWMNASATVHESTLAHSLNMFGIPTLVVEMGQGHHIMPEYGNQIVEGILNIMKHKGIWSGSVAMTQEPAVSSDGEVEFIRSNHSGLFIALAEHNHYVQKDEVIGQVVHPFKGELLEVVKAENAGLLFTQRIYPVVYEGDLLARILTGVKN